MMNKQILEMNLEAVNEIKGIMNNPVLNVQVLIVMQLVSKGVYLSVELVTKNSSRIFGKLHLCTGHSFAVPSDLGLCADIRFTDIKIMEISNLKMGA